MTLILECSEIVSADKTSLLHTTIYRVLSSQSDDPTHSIPENVVVETDRLSGRVTITVGVQPIPKLEPPAPKPEPLPSLYPDTMVESVNGTRLRFKAANLPNPHCWNVYYGKLAVGFMHGPPPAKVVEVKKQSWACKIVLADVPHSIDRWTATGSVKEARREFCRRIDQILSVAEIDGVEDETL